MQFLDFQFNPIDRDNDEDIITLYLDFGIWPQMTDAALRILVRAELGLPAVLNGDNQLCNVIVAQ